MSVLSHTDNKKAIHNIKLLQILPYSTFKGTLLNSLVGTGSKRQIDGADEETVKVGSERSVEKESKYKSVQYSRLNSKATVLDNTSVPVVGRR